MSNKDAINMCFEALSLSICKLIYYDIWGIKNYLIYLGEINADSIT